MFCLSKLGENSIQSMDRPTAGLTMQSSRFEETYRKKRSMQMMTVILDVYPGSM